MGLFGVQTISCQRNHRSKIYYPEGQAVCILTRWICGREVKGGGGVEGYEGQRAPLIQIYPLLGPVRCLSLLFLPAWASLNQTSVLSCCSFHHLSDYFLDTRVLPLYQGLPLVSHPCLHLSSFPSSPPISLLCWSDIICFRKAISPSLESVGYQDKVTLQSCFWIKQKEGREILVFLSYFPYALYINKKEKEQNRKRTRQKQGTCSVGSFYKNALRYIFI